MPGPLTGSRVASADPWGRHPCHQPAMNKGIYPTALDPCFLTWSMRQNPQEGLTSCQAYSWAVVTFAWPARTNLHKAGGFQQQKYVLQIPDARDPKPGCGGGHSHSEGSWLAFRTFLASPTAGGFQHRLGCGCVSPIVSSGFSP